MEEISVKSIAKINLGLNIISKREDGYHNLETIFYPLELHDEIVLRKSRKFTFKTNSQFLNNEKNNLIVKATELLENFIGEKFTVEIKLNKKIPIGAGLGGGSSNAAFTLAALNELFQLNIPNEKLRELGLNLGSDVPLFLYDLPAYAESRGENLRKINFRISDHILIINPGIHISTKWAFSKISPNKSENNLVYVITNYPKDYKVWQKLIKNDFESIVLMEFQELKDLKNSLTKLGSDFCLMSGSGSTFFGIFSNYDKLIEAKKYFQQKNYFVHSEIAK